MSCALPWICGASKVHNAQDMINQEQQTKPTGKQSLSTVEFWNVDEHTARLYEGKCCFCKFFRDAYFRDKKNNWVDNPGWCVRFPPIYVGKKISSDVDVAFQQFGQPVVDGGSECGEFVQARPNEDRRRSPVLPVAVDLVTK